MPDTQEVQPKQAETKEYIVVKPFFFAGVESSVNDKVQLDLGQYELVKNLVKKGV